LVAVTISSTISSASLLGIGLPEGLALDGEDRSDVWLGATADRRRPLHWEWLFAVQGPDDGYRPPPLAVRDGPWKFFVQHDGSGAGLYQIPTDPGEEHDVAAAEPARVAALTARALAWVATLPESPARTAVAASPPARRIRATP
jgi:hypothetical protein